MLIKSLTGPTLSVACRSPIGVRLIIQMAMLAMCSTATVRRHGQPFPEYTYFRVKQFLERFALLRSRHNRIGFQSGSIREIHCFIGDTFNCYREGIMPIAHLIFSRRPFAVCRLIRSFIVDSFYGEIWRPVPHIFIEGSKTIPPPIADRDASPTVSMIFRNVWIQATRFDTYPYFVNRMPAKMVALISHVGIIAEIRRISNGGPRVI